MEEYNRQKLQHYNAILMTIEGSLFVICASLLDSGTVIAVFTKLKTGSTSLAGFAGALVFLGPLIGTTIMGNIINRLKKPARVMMILGFITRMMVAPTLLALAFHLPDRLQAFVLVLGYGLFYMGDGPVGLIWTDILARTQPVRQRLYIHSMARVFGGIFGFAVAYLIKRVYASSLPVDSQFMIIFGCATFCMFMNAVVLSQIRDDPNRIPTETEKTPWKKYFAGFLPLIKSNDEVRHAVISKCLYYMAMLTVSLNLLFAKELGNLPESGVGTLVFMPIAGLIVGGFLWANLGKSLGYRQVMLVSHGLNVASAALTIVSLILSRTGHSVLVPMAIVMLLLSANLGAQAGFGQHIISVVDEKDRASYIVLLSLFTAPFTLASALAGILADAFGYPIVFILFAILAPIGFLYTLKNFFGKNYRIQELH